MPSRGPARWCVPHVVNIAGDAERAGILLEEATTELGTIILYMKKHLFVVAAAAALCAGSTARAHISYSGRNFGSLAGGGGVTSITNQTVSSAFGWADATDSDWGDSHRGRFFRFTLTNSASVRISVQRNNTGSGAANTFLPALSVFAGLGQAVNTNTDGVVYEGVFRIEQAGHDAAALSTNSRPAGTEGSFRSRWDWSVGNDDTYVTNGNPTSGILIPARLAYFTYIGHMADGTSTNYGSAGGLLGDGVADGSVTATFDNLPVGDYSFFVGGANYGAQVAEPGPTFPTYGVNVSVQALALPAYEAGLASVTSNPTAHGLYTPSAILDLNLGGLVIQGDGTNATLRIQPQTAESLELPFEDFGTPIDVPVPMDSGKAFLRVNAQPLP